MSSPPKHCHRYGERMWCYKYFYNTLCRHSIDQWSSLKISRPRNALQPLSAGYPCVSYPLRFKRTIYSVFQKHILTLAFIKKQIITTTLCVWRTFHCFRRRQFRAGNSGCLDREHRSGRITSLFYHSTDVPGRTHENDSRSTGYTSRPRPDTYVEWRRSTAVGFFRIVPFLHLKSVHNR